MANSYILDTNIISYLVDEKSPYSAIISDRLSSLSNKDKVGVSILTLYELTYGLEYSNDDKEIEIFNNAISLIQSYLHIYDLSIDEIGIFAKLKKSYKTAVGINQKALKKSDIDFLIASSAIANQAILVSNDKIFEAITSVNSNLSYENWI